MIQKKIEKKYLESPTLDEDFRKMIENKSKVNNCIQCGTCTSSCPSGRWTAIKTRTIIRKASMGDASVLADPDIWLCTTCYDCYERCPRNIKPTEVIIDLRNMAVAKGFMHPNHEKTTDVLKKFGHAVPINDTIKAMRKELGIAEVPPTIFTQPEELELFGKTFFDLDELVESRRGKKGKRVNNE